MGTLNAEQIFQVCLDAGFTRDQAVTWTAIALAESGGDTAAHNPRGEDSWGLWQINVDPAVRPNHWGDLTDPAVNAQAAYEVSQGGTDMRPWTVTHDSNAGTDHDYRNFMDEAQAAAGGDGTGDFSGVSGYHDGSPTGGDQGDPGTAAIPPVDPGADTDSDHDGATDAFEMSHGTDPRVPDSDSDGLTDGFELTHDLDATTFDSDGDGLSDRHEVRVGSDALSTDSDADGVQDAVELSLGRDTRHGLRPDVAPGVDGDSDDDGLSDAWEAAVGTDPTSGDSDQDGVADVVEIVERADALNPDSDGDGELDGVDLLADLRAEADAPPPAAASFTGVDPDALPTIAAVQAEVAQLTGLTESLAAAGLTGPATPAAPALDPIDPVAPGIVGLTGVTDGGAALAGPVGGVGAVGPMDRLRAAGVGTGDPVATAAADGGEPDAPDAVSGTTQQFLDAALAQTGDDYVFGGEAAPDDADPDTFDCSELTQWAAGQVGVDLPDGSWLQYLELEQQGALVPLEEGLRTPGALLFSFSSEPTAAGGRPAEAHVAISLGNGETIEARSTRYGVGSWEAGDRFTYAAVLPDLGAVPAPSAVPLAPPAIVPDAADDRDADGVVDAFEMSHGTDPLVADSDGDGLSDGFELGSGLDSLRLDADGDGLSDAWEVRLGTDPNATDSDGDGVADAMEVSLGRDARFGLHATATPTLVLDADDDGLSDAWETSLGSDPLGTDSDHDGLSDALELSRHTDPDDPDTDDDGELDRWDTLDDPDP